MSTAIVRSSWMGAPTPRKISYGWAIRLANGMEIRWSLIPSASTIRLGLPEQGVPHTDQLHVVERFSRPDLGHLQIDITLEDPGAFTKPHSFQRVYNLMQNTDLLEYVCNEFNIDKDHLYGK